MIKNTKQQCKLIPEWCEKHNIKTVADIGAGDLNWLKTLDWNVDYSGFDLVPRAEGVQQFDLIAEVPPAKDMIMCLWVLNHLPPEAKDKALTNLVNSDSKYLLLSIHNLETAPPFEVVEKLELSEKGDAIYLFRNPHGS